MNKLGRSCLNLFLHFLLVSVSLVSLNGFSATLLTSREEATMESLSQSQKERECALELVQIYDDQNDLPSSFDAFSYNLRKFYNQKQTVKVFYRYGGGTFDDPLTDDALSWQVDGSTEAAYLLGDIGDDEGRDIAFRSGVDWGNLGFTLLTSASSLSDQGVYISKGYADALLKKHSAWASYDDLVASQVTIRYEDLAPVVEGVIDDPSGYFSLAYQNHYLFASTAFMKKEASHLSLNALFTDERLTNLTWLKGLKKSLAASSNLSVRFFDYLNEGSFVLAHADSVYHSFAALRFSKTRLLVGLAFLALFLGSFLFELLFFEKRYPANGLLMLPLTGLGFLLDYLLQGAWASSFQALLYVNEPPLGALLAFLLLLFFLVFFFFAPKGHKKGPKGEEEKSTMAKEISHHEQN
jgi:hypothetical protein